MLYSTVGYVAVVHDSFFLKADVWSAYIYTKIGLTKR